MLKRKILALLSVVVFCSFLSQASANTTVITNDRGGFVLQYILKYQKLKENNSLVQIKGMCASACTLVFLLPEEQICVDPSSEMLFHQATFKGVREEVATKYLFDHYPPWLKKFISDKGGLTSNNIIADYNFLKQYLTTCAD